MRQLASQLTTCDKPFHRAPALQGQTISFSNNGKHNSLLAHLTLLKNLAQSGKENSSSSHGPTCFKKNSGFGAKTSKKTPQRSSRFAVFLPHLQISLLATCEVKEVEIAIEAEGEANS